MSETNLWQRCGSCKKPILLQQKYFACGISSCRKSSYCSLSCFDAHSPVFRHKDAWAEEKIAPKSAEPTSSKFASANLVSRTQAGPTQAQREILIVASKLKDYIRFKSGMNTSAGVLERLSDMV